MSKQQRSISRPVENPDRDVVQAFRQKDREAVELVQVWIRHIVGFRQFGIPMSDRGDIVDEVLRQLWEAVNRPDFAVRTSFRSLVYRISSCRCVDWLRILHRERQQTVPIPDLLISKNPNPEEELLRQERRELGLKVLSALSSSCRELIALREEHTFTTIAKMKRCSAGALRVKMYGCIQKAREILRQYEQGENRGTRPSEAPSQ